MLVNFIDLFDKVVHRAFLELAYPDPAVSWLDQFATHRLLLDFFPDDGDWKAAVLILAKDGQNDFGGGLTAHALNRFVEAQAFDGGFVNLGDQVIGLDAGPKRGRALNGRHHLHQAVFLGDFYAHADKSSRRAFTELFEGLFVKVAGMRVQAGHHAGNRVGDEFFLVHRLYIIALDQPENGGELLQLF